MRKISKLSLVAAVAVAGFSTANAQPLEEAIKNVDVSGSVVYRYDNFDEDNYGTSTQNNKYKIGLNLSSKVNDYVKFNSRFIVGAQDTGDFVGLESKDGGDGNADVFLSQANFAFTGIQNTTVIAGKQGLATPWTVAIDSDGNEHTGTGILALTTVGPVTAGAGYFNQTNLDKQNNNGASQGLANGMIPNSASNIAGLYDGRNAGSRDLYVGTLQADLSPVKLEAWYLDMADTLDSYTLVAKANFAPSTDSKIGVEARYVSLTLDHGKDVGLGSDDNSMYRLAVTGNLSIVNARVAYTATDDKGGLTAFDQDSENASLGWTLTSNGVPDAEFWQGTLGVNILDNLNLAAHYGNLDASDIDYKAEEIFGQLTYKMSKNLSTYVRYGTLEQKIDGDKVRDRDMGRLQIEYTF
ncbi:major outer membrane protein [Aliarcobacter butzleri]|uniref:major outer membrane protein n=1 Tax=Aliarcobacter butzleri TaxID=28197 RepID=UPI00062E5761|nr:major outer membrane protein [Aliarcobacter butzleri]KLD98438.1 membrane protein [Aliarcobacter butzleri L349]